MKPTNRETEAPAEQRVPPRYNHYIVISNLDSERFSFGRLPCQGCGFDLADAESSICPFCGWILNQQQTPRREPSRREFRQPLLWYSFGLLVLTPIVGATAALATFTTSPIRNQWLLWACDVVMALSALAAFIILLASSLVLGTCLVGKYRRRSSSPIRTDDELTGAFLGFLLVVPTAYLASKICGAVYGLVSLL